MIHVFPSPERAAEGVAERLVEESARAVAARGRFRLAVPGGATPIPLYQRLASVAWRARLDWSRVELYFTDERAVPPDAPDSNFALVQRSLAAPLGLAPDQLRRMRAEAPDLDAAAAEYERGLEQPLDVVLLGMGADGHVASLFPGSGLVEETQRRAASVADSPKPPARRMTLTPRALREARALLVLCTGDDKAGAVALTLNARPAPRECPATLAADGDWYLDQAAAARL